MKTKKLIHVFQLNARYANPFTAKSRLLDTSNEELYLDTNARLGAKAEVPVFYADTLEELQTLMEPALMHTKFSMSIVQRQSRGFWLSLVVLAKNKPTTKRKKDHEYFILRRV